MSLGVLANSPALPRGPAPFPPYAAYLLQLGGVPAPPKEPYSSLSLKEAEWMSHEKSIQVYFLEDFRHCSVVNAVEYRMDVFFPATSVSNSLRLRPLCDLTFSSFGSRCLELLGQLSQRSRTFSKVNTCRIRFFEFRRIELCS